ncbi:Nup133p RNJ42_01087 [Nakaseomyces bracarensis]|uniref:Nup133p n=1 Tax=Nakaseomyces bracarensis TaxID=273131 RepID=UPI00387205FE
MDNYNQLKKNIAMSDSKPYFQLRKEILESDSNPASEKSKDLLQETNIGDQSKVLTENDKYIARKIDTLHPENFSATNNVPYFSTIDSLTKQCSYNDYDNMYVWNFLNAKRGDSNYCKIPLNGDDEVSQSVLPKCVFTHPVNTETEFYSASSELDANGAGVVGGVILVETAHACTKLVYYEDISSINHLSTSISKKMAHTLDLKLNADERILITLNFEPSGLVLATSEGRLLFVTIRDLNGKPHLEQKQQLMRSKGSGPMLILNLFSSSSNVVSLKNGPIVGKGERLIYALTENGRFQIWQLSIGTKCIKKMDVNVYDLIMDSLVDIYPHAQGSLKIQDAHSVTCDPFSPQIILSQISDGEERSFILSTIMLDENSNTCSIFSNYRLNTYTLPASDEVFQVKLYIPSSIQDNISESLNIFVMFDNAIVLTQTSSRFDSTYTMRKKWEDIISFNKDIQILACSNDATTLYLLTHNMGIITITPKDNNDDFEEEESFVKTHIDQAIYFSLSSGNPIEFNLPSGLHLEQDEIEKDLDIASNEILHSSSKYIPPTTENVDQHLALRMAHYKKLLEFVKNNFNYSISPRMKLNLIEKFELLNSSFRFHQFIKNTDDTIRYIWLNVLSAHANIDQETLIIKEIKLFPELLTQFLKNIVTKELPVKTQKFKETLADLIIETIYGSILEDGEKKLRYEALSLDPLELNDHLPWFINYDILDSINQIFFDLNFSTERQNEDVSNRLLTMVKILYYLFNQVRLYALKNKSMNEINNDEFMQKTNELYENNHLSWNHVLCEQGMNEQSLEIAEFYHDFEALVETLDTLDRDNSQVLYEEYFTKFKEEFAFALYKHYIEKKNLSDLFYRFPERKEYLMTFFKQYPEYGKISWIQDILHKDYSSAAMTLYDISENERNSGKTINTSQLHLNIAKLTTVAANDDGKNVNILGALKKIQENLDVIDGQQDLISKLNGTNGEKASLLKKYDNTELKKVFENISNRLKKNETIRFEEIIEIYTLIDQEEGFYNALKLIALDGNLLHFEVRKFLTSMIWRRCILYNDFAESTENKDTAINYVLTRYFEDELFRSDCPLPSPVVINERGVLTEEYLRNVYSRYDVDVHKVKEIFEKEFESMQQNSAKILNRIDEILAGIDEKKTQAFSINYHNHTVEY